MNPATSNEPKKLATGGHTSTWQLVLYSVFFLFSVAAIGITSYVTGQEQLLLDLTVENSFYEIASVLVLLVLSGFCLLRFIQHRNQPTIHYVLKAAWLGIGLLALLAAGEELSWGQHLLGFSSTEFFNEHNLQQETNLHNLVPGHLFAGFLNTSVYIVFVFGPALVWFFPTLIGFLGPLAPLFPTLMPSIHISLMMCFAGSLHPYFLATSTVSTSALLLALICLAAVIWRVQLPSKTSLIVHWLAVVAAMIFFMANTHVFSYFNMQAEVREFFVMLAGLFWVMEWSRRAERTTRE